MDRRAALRTLALLAAAGCTRSGPTAAPSPGAPSPAPAGSSTPPASTPATTAPPTTAPTTPPAAAATTVELVCRDAWGARPAGDAMVPHTIRQLTVHHSAARLDEVSRGPAQLRGHQAFHMDGRGWADLAYHVCIDRGGVLYMGRRWDRAGDTGTNYDPAGHFLLLLDGSFNEQEPSGAQLDTAAATIAWATTRFGFGLDAVSGHRDHADTACPGDALYARIPDLVATARGHLEAGGVDLAERCGADGAAFVADIEAGRT